MVKKILIPFVLLLLNNLAFGQINSDCYAKVYHSHFDSVFEQEYASIKADTVLTIRHCYTTNGCHETYGIICWKISGVFSYKYLYRSRRGHKIHITSHIKNSIKEHLCDFFTKKIYKDTAINPINYILDDGPCTTVVLLTPSHCWTYSENFFPNDSKDIREIWANRLDYIML